MSTVLPTHKIPITQRQQRYVYRQTDKAKEELETRTHGLRAMQRRVLSAVDGYRSVIELTLYTRPGDVDKSLPILIDAGFVEFADEVPGSKRFDRFGTENMSMEERAHFETVRQRAAGHVLRHIGVAASESAKKIAACDSPDQLRLVLREIEPMLTEHIEKQDVREFCRLVGRSLLGKQKAIR
jgi:hypothetical protein